MTHEIINNCIATAFSVTTLGVMLSLIFIGIKTPDWVKTFLEVMMISGFISIFIFVVVKIWT